MIKQHYLWLKVSALLVSCTFFFSCGDIISSDESTIIQISYGTSFGECIGYCSKSIQVNSDSLVLHESGWDMHGSLPVINKTMQLESEIWDEIIRNIDFEAFAKLDSVIGCPDCADGGAEWIEIGTLDSKHKVVFEYRNEPSQLKESIHYLRAFQYASSNSRNFEDDVFFDKEFSVVVKVCTRGCYQYLLKTSNNEDKTLLFPEWLDAKFRVANLNLKVSGVLSGDSTIITKPAANDIPIFDFKAPNLRVFRIQEVGNE